jgi:hypothetical protein
MALGCPSYRVQALCTTAISAEDLWQEHPAGRRHSRKPKYLSGPLEPLVAEAGMKYTGRWGRGHAEGGGGGDEESGGFRSNSGGGGWKAERMRGSHRWGSRRHEEVPGFEVPGRWGRHAAGAEGAEEDW